MNPEIKQRWVSALRSGMYEQGYNALYTEGTYCCLGVLCDLYAQEKNGERLDAESVQKYGDKGETDLPSNEVIEWAGMAEQNPVVEVDSESPEKFTVAELNDRGEYSFVDLAYMIEAQL